MAMRLGTKIVQWIETIASWLSCRNNVVLVCNLALGMWKDSSPYEPPACAGGGALPVRI